MNKLGFHLIGKSNEDFESCLDCVHADDSEEICTMRKCVHAIKFLYDCYEKRKDAPDTNVGKWIREVLGSTSGYGTQGRERNMTKEDAGQMLNTFIDCLYTNLTEERYWELKDAVKAMQEQKKTNLIDRQDAIDAVHYYIESGYKCDIFQELKDLPSAESERTGRCIWCDGIEDKRLRIEFYWIDEEGCTASFSEPHMVATGIAKYCPECGRRLKMGR